MATYSSKRLNDDALFAAEDGGSAMQGEAWFGALAADPATARDDGRTSAAVGEPVAATSMSGPFINEFHYANNGPDQGEFVEIATPVGTSLSGYGVFFYDGATGQFYRSAALGGGVSNPSNGFAFETIQFVITDAIENGPDAIALVDAAGRVLEFLSYGGAFTATNGPAAGLTSTDVGATESESTSQNSSIARVGTGDGGSDFTFVNTQASTPGRVNENQTFAMPPPAGPTITGTPNDDTISGTDLGETINAGAGNDTVFARGGDDTVNGEAGNDILQGDAGNDVLNGSDGNDTLIGGVGNDVLNGGVGSDMMNGGAGDDRVTGGAGDDIYSIDIAVDGSDGVDLGEGSDLVRVGDSAQEIRLTFTSAGVGNGDANDADGMGNVRMQAEGETTAGSNNMLTGPQSRFDDEGVTFSRGSGRTFDVRDTGGAERGNRFQFVVLGTTASEALTAFEANSVYYFNAGMGNDLVTGGNVNDFLVGGAGDDELRGGGGNDTLLGGTGDDLLNGGTGIDTMSGGVGNDIYFVDTGRTSVFNGTAFVSDPGDIVTELANEGIDEVRTTFDYTLAANVENLTGVSTTRGLMLTGNSLANIVTGTAFADTIVGTLGADRLIGGAGDDTYEYNAAENVIVEDAGGGTDTVRTAFVRFKLGDNIENLIGNNFAAQTLIGNTLNNVITGMDGDDFFDLRDGGDDTAVGGTGNNAFLFGAAFTSADRVQAGPGNDQVGLQGDYTGARAVTLVSFTGVETLILQSGDDARFGDTANNSYSYDVTTTDDNMFAGRTLTIDANRLRSGETSTFNGAAETDGRFIYIGGAGRDDVTTGAGNDVIRLGAGGDVARAGAGNDLIDGGAGQDLMFGGAGDDVYILDEMGDTPVEDAGAGTDEVRTDLRSVFLGIFANVENLTGTSNSGQSLGGNGLNNVITGAGGNDLIDARQGGDDSLFGNAGDDAFLFAGAMTTADRVDGGVGGNDQLGIQGDYTGARALTLGAVTNIETLLFLSGDDNRFGNGTGASFGYAVTTNDANVAAGATLTIDANRLRPGENVVFDGSAETDGGFFVFAGQGVDRLVGGAGDDVFLFREPGGFTAADRIVGGAGFDQLGLRGNYAGSGALSLDADTLIGVEGIVLISGRDTRFGRDTGQSFSYDLSSGDGAVTAGQTFTVDAGTLRAGETLRFFGSLEFDGNFRIFGGDGNDNIRGGFGNDAIRGGLGADRLDGSEGADVFRYDSVTESTAAQTDVLVVFQSGRDRIDLSRIDADQTNGAGNDAFRFIGSAAFSGSAGELRTVFDTGTRMGRIEGDVNGDGVADLVIALDGLGGGGNGDRPTQLAAGDFNF